MLLRSVIYELDFDLEADAIFGDAATRDDALRAIEWELARALHLGAYPIAVMTQLGPLRVIRTATTEVHLGVVVLFTHDDRLGQVTLHSIRRVS